MQDWVGRCIAQSKTSKHTRAITLTYGGGDHERATVLTYSDVQKYFKRLRKAGFKFRFVVAGEYGTRKGRAHWHAVLFFDGPMPKHVLRQNYECPFWGHGHTFWDECDPKSLRYVCKYILKTEEDQEAQAHFAMSKRPPIGAEYFEALARTQVEQGLSPQDLRYSFKDNVDKDGKMVQHYMHGATAEIFLDAFIAAWRAKHGNDRWPNSGLLDGDEERLGYMDKLASYAPDPAFEVRKYGVIPKRLPRTGATLQFSETLNAYYCVVDGSRYLWRKTIGNPDTEWSWHDPENREVRFEALDPKSSTPSQERHTRTEARKTTSQKLGEIRLRSQADARANAKRLPMVGDDYYSHPR